MLISPNTEPGKGDLSALLSLGDMDLWALLLGEVLSPKAGTKLLPWATSPSGSGSCLGALCSLFTGHVSLQWGSDCVDEICFEQYPEPIF